MLKVKFTPEPLISCQKLYWMYRDGLFDVVHTGQDITFNWNYTGVHFQHLRSAVNGWLINTSKSYCEKIFKEVYGYSSEAGPGLAVEKSDSVNGFKDARVTHMRRPGYFYQKLLFNSGWVKERRVVVMGGEPVYSIIKFKQVNTKNIPGRVIEYDFDENYKDPLVTEFCRRYPMDYGELDIMTFEGKDYIIDVNPTPGDAAFVHMPEIQSKKYINDYKKLLETWLTSLL